MEEVEDYKYFGVVIDKRLIWKSNTEAVYREICRLYFLRKLRSFSESSKKNGDLLTAAETSTTADLIRMLDPLWVSDF